MNGGIFNIGLGETLIPAQVYCRRAEWGDQADDRDGDVPGPGGGQTLRRGDQYPPDSLQAEVRQPQVNATISQNNLQFAGRIHVHSQSVQSLQKIIFFSDC